MKFSFLFFVGLVGVILSIFYIITPDYFQPSNLNEAFAQSEDKNKNFDKVVTNSIEKTKIHPAIPQILEHSNPRAMAKTYGASIENDYLYVYVHLADKKIQNKSLDIEILARDENIIVSKLSLNQIQSLAKLESVNRITLPDHAVFYDHDGSEGVSFSMADAMHLAGFNGTGINVAVIDDSFFINNTEISSRIIHSQLFDSENFCAGVISCGMPVNGSHGTAVAEIVVDMAPGVNLLLYAVGNGVDFNNAVDDAMNRNSHIITASLGFPTQGGDGSNINHWYRDGTSSSAKKVNEAKANGTLFTVATGNQGDKHWSDFYVPVNSTTLNGTILQFDLDNTFTVVYESVMMFNSSAAGAMQACLPVTNNGDAYSIRWNGWLTTDQDYDVMLYNSTADGFLNFGSFGSQNGDVNSIPVESFASGHNGDACLVLASFNTTENHLFHIEMGDNNILNLPENDTRRLGSIDSPADSIGALSVGAINFNNTPTNYSDDTLEVFSSRGPTDDGRQIDDGRPKPEICGPDRTLTHQTASPFNGTFTGTSASTPHVAGAAALLLEQDPSLTVDQLKQKLIDNARFSASYSVDNLCGSDSGALSLLGFGACLNVPSSGIWTITQSCILIANASMDGLLVQNNSVLTIPAGITLDIDFVNSNLTVKSGSGVLIKSGGTIT